MQVLKGFTALSVTTFILLFSCLIHAQETTSETNIVTEQKKAYISDNLYVYMLAGAGQKFRILGSVNAGSEIQLTGEVENGYTQIISPKGKIGWVESKFINTNQSLRDVIAQLNAQLAQNADNEAQSQTLLSNANNEITTLTSKNKELQQTITALNEELSMTQSKIQTQDQEQLKQWFFNGAIVLGIGLLVGIILPSLFRRKAKKSSWG